MTHEPKVSRRGFIGAGLAGASVLGMAAHASDKPAPRPNIMFILVDDMRFDQMSCAGHPYLETPNLDRLANEGVMFTRAYVSCPLCGPVRGSIFTGRMPSAHNVRNHQVLKEMEYPEGDFFPGMMQDVGYRTAMMGKWFQGDGPPLPRPEFDRWFINNGVKHPTKAPSPKERQAFYWKHMYYDMMYNVDGEFKQIDGYNTDILFEEAARFATEQSSNPFFCFLSPFAPHAPFNVAPRHKGKFEGKGIPPQPSLDLEEARKRAPNVVSDYERQCEMVLAIDEGMGRLLGALEKADILDETMIVFTSDNGFMFGEHGKNWKQMPWEESARVPLLVRYPPMIKPGRKCDALVSLADIGVTFNALAAAPPLSEAYGRSIAPLLDGSKQKVRDDLLMQFYPGGSPAPDIPEWCAIVTERYKYAAYSGSSENLLFDLEKDPLEMKNLADDPACAGLRQELVQKLKQRMAENGAAASWID